MEWLTLLALLDGLVHAADSVSRRHASLVEHLELYNKSFLRKFSDSAYGWTPGVPKTSLRDALVKFGGSKCFDPRDRIYGLLQIVEWPQRLGPILADYTRSGFDLGVVALKYLVSTVRVGKSARTVETTAQYAKPLLEDLEINDDDEKAQQTALGLTDFRADAQRHHLELHPRDSFLDVTNRCNHIPVVSNTSSMIMLPSGGHFYISQVTEDLNPGRQAPALLNGTTSQKHQPQLLMDRGTLVGYLAPEAKLGDLMMHIYTTGDAQGWDVYLALGVPFHTERRDERYRTIRPALVRKPTKGHRLPNDRAIIRWYLDASDMIELAARCRYLDRRVDQGQNPEFLTAYIRTWVMQGFCRSYAIVQEKPWWEERADMALITDVDD